MRRCFDFVCGINNLRTRISGAHPISFAFLSNVITVLYILFRFIGLGKGHSKSTMIQKLDMSSIWGEIIILST